MGKEKPGPLTAKAIGNRIKSKGLQKLRWYCQVCQKQCRDENGFKCHCMSESHQRQLLLVGESAGQFTYQYSKEFCRDFLDILKRRFGTKRVQNNVVYNEYISNKDHVHMNATRWTTLSGFTQWLGREGICKIDLTEKGWFMQYIERDPKVIQRQKELERIKRKERGDEERHAKVIEEMVERGTKVTEDQESGENSKALVRNEEEKITLNLFSKTESSTGSSKTDTKDNLPVKTNMLQAFKRKTDDKVSVVKPKIKKKSALEEIIAEEKKTNANKTETIYDNWLVEGIIVKIITDRLGKKYHKKKGVIMSVENKYAAIVKMLDTGAKVKVDQMHVETVLPAIGKQVLILNGKYRNNIATMEEVNVKKFNATVKIQAGKYKNKLVDKLPYEHISKRHIE